MFTSGRGLIYFLSTERYCGWGCSVALILSHSCAVSASHRASFHGRVSLSSAALIQSDCENSTACCVSHIKQSRASLSNRSAQAGTSDYQLNEPSSLFGIDFGQPPVVWIVVLARNLTSSRLAVTSSDKTMYIVS